jgi:dihydroorotate dehydrogenase (fumarate)
MLDLSTKYLGFDLKTPLVVSASPLTRNLENIRRMEQAGAGAIVMHSLFEEQITLESSELDCYLSRNASPSEETKHYFPDMQGYNLGPEGYLEHLRKAREATKIPLIGSLNGVSTGTWSNWIDYARKIQEAGADALELNIYFIPTDSRRTGEQIEQLYLSLVQSVKRMLTIPLAVRISPYFSSLSYMAQRLEHAGADALVLFNRFYQPDFDIEKQAMRPGLQLSTPEELLLRLHWTAILSPGLRLGLAVSGGVHTAPDVIKAIMAGASVAMMTSALLRNGIGHLAEVVRGLEEWLSAHDVQALHQIQGRMSHRSVAEPAAFERAYYLRVLNSYP